MARGGTRHCGKHRHACLQQLRLGLDALGLRRPRRQHEHEWLLALLPQPREKRIDVCRLMNAEEAEHDIHVFVDDDNLNGWLFRGEAYGPEEGVESAKLSRAHVNRVPQDAAHFTGQGLQAFRSSDEAPTTAVERG